MRFKIFEASTQIGEAELYALDPPMCVAMAKFLPAEAYDPAHHANVIDGDYVGDRSEILRIEMEDGSTLKCGVISIQDYLKPGEREVQIIEIHEPSFDELFREHPDFKAYWGNA